MYKFECGCEFPIFDENASYNGLPSIYIDYDNINLRCPATWQILCEGHTKGVFQLETNLGKSWAKKVQPLTIEELAALIAILRPGTLKGMIDNKSIAQHYADRNIGEESCDPFNENVRDILSNTNGMMIYQEQVLGISQSLAGFDLKQGMGLLKGIGKKKADIVFKYRQEFVDGCKNSGIVTGEDAEAIFDVISKSARYLFNASHSVSYSITSYWCAYVKAHFPLHFFTSWLTYALEKSKPREEIAELINEAKQFNINVENPNIFHKNQNFVIDSGKIRYGIGSIKSLGSENFNTVINSIKNAETVLGKELNQFSWHDILLYLLPDIRKDVVNNLVHSGALSNFGVPRCSMLFQYNKLTEIKSHIPWLRNATSHISLSNDIETVLASKPRLTQKQRDKLNNILISILNPPINMVDAVEIVAGCEEDVLGIALSCSKLDAKNLGAVNCTCKQFSTGEKTLDVIVGVQINRISEWSPPDSDKKMAFMTVSDKTGKIEVSVPTKEYNRYGFLLFNNNTIAISGNINKKGGLQAKAISQL